MDPFGRIAILCPNSEARKKQVPLDVWNLKELEPTLPLEDFVLEYGKRSEIIVTQRGDRALARKEVSDTLDSTSALQLYDLASGKRLWSVDGSFAILSQCMITPDGSRAAIPTKSHELEIWDLRAGLCQGSLGVHSGWISVLGWSPSVTLLLAHAAGMVALWNVEEKRQVATFDVDADVFCGCFVNESQFLLGASDGAVHLLTFHP